jgi:hypothetical protein
MAALASLLAAMLGPTGGAEPPRGLIYERRIYPQDNPLICATLVSHHRFDLLERTMVAAMRHFERDEPEWLTYEWAWYDNGSGQPALDFSARVQVERKHLSPHNLGLPAAINALVRDLCRAPYLLTLEEVRTAARRAAWRRDRPRAIVLGGRCARVSGAKWRAARARPRATRRAGKGRARAREDGATICGGGARERARGDVTRDAPSALGVPARERGSFEAAAARDTRALAAPFAHAHAPTAMRRRSRARPPARGARAPAGLGVRGRSRRTAGLGAESGRARDQAR